MGKVNFYCKYYLLLDKESFSLDLFPTNMKDGLPFWGINNKSYVQLLCLGYPTPKIVYFRSLFQHDDYS